MADIVAQRYKLNSLLPTDSGPQVWRAMDLESQDMDVVQIFVIGHGLLPEVLHNILWQRARALKNFYHPLLIPLKDYGFWESQGQYYFVFPEKRYTRLQSYLADAVPRLEWRVNLLLAVTDLFCDLHAAGIAHGDLHIGDIVLDLSNPDDLQVKVNHLGLAHLLALADEEKQDNLGASYQALFGHDLDRLRSLAALILTGNGGHVADDLAQFVSSQPEHLIEPFRRLFLPREEEVLGTVLGLRRDLQRLAVAIASQETFHVKLTDWIVEKLHDYGFISEQRDYLAYDMLNREFERGVVAWHDGKHGEQRGYRLTTAQLRIYCVPEERSDPPGALLATGAALTSGTDIMFDHQIGLPVHCRLVAGPSNKVPPNADVTPLLKRIDAHVQAALAVDEAEHQQQDNLARWETVIEQQQRQLHSFQKKYVELRVFARESAIVLQLAEALDESDDLAPDTMLRVTTKQGHTQPLGYFEAVKGDSMIIGMAGSVNVDNLAEQGYVTIDNAQIAVVLARQKAALRRLRFGETANPRLAEILSNISQAELICDNARPITTWHHPFLDESQKEAVRWALSARDLFLIQGPPGTGKTCVIAEIVLQILDRDPQARILIASQSNVAVNHAITRIVAARRELEPKTVRIGREEKAGVAETMLLGRQMNRWAGQVLADSARYMERWRSQAPDEPATSDRAGRMQDAIEADVAAAQIVAPRHQATGDDWLRFGEVDRLLDGWKQRVAKDRAGFTPTYLAQCAVVGATCIGVAGKGEVGEMDFDWVIVDEAGRATPPELLVPLIRGRRMVLVGDHLQLPPTIDRALQQAIANEGLDRRQFQNSLFQDLWEGVPATVKRSLNRQYRMHPSIGRMIAECFYGGSRNLQAGVAADERVHGLAWCSRPVIWYSTAKLTNHHETAVGLSYRNELEVQVILRLLDRIHDSYVQQDISGKSIGVITGYMPQKNAIEQRLYAMRDGWTHFSIVDVNTVDAYQGQERDIVIYSVVRSNRHGKIGFLKDFRRLNVALSRARELVVVVGDPAVEYAVVRDYNPFYTVLKFLRANPSDALITGFEL